MHIVAPRILIVTDQFKYSRLLEQHLTTVWADVEIKVHEPSHSGSFHPGFTAAGFDCVLLDHELTDDRGLAWATDFSTRTGFPPVLYFAANDDGRKAVEAGAADWFMRDRIHHRRFASVVIDHVMRRRQLQALFRAGPEGDKLYRFGPITIRGQRYVGDLAVGGSSMVYLAESEKAGELVVLKVLGDNESETGQTFERFLQEYELLLRIRHPNVVRIHEMGIADDHAYIAMEYFPIGDLRARMRDKMSPEQVVVYTEQVARALAEVHEVGVLHRDLKPGNIMLRADGSIALIDFGLAKHVVRSAEITAAGEIFGTPYYISPEQGHGDDVDARSDLYSLGIIVYEMMMGKRPFTAGSPMSIIYMHRNSPVPPLSPELKRYEPLVYKLLAKEPNDRYQSAAELLDALPAFQ
ncbi:MAG TPA: serine/threonine-protein kinase [Steroidobacteraceae bacterium]|nr:serine/threonine-protein kinase [Steroidobacteraceae bacterium]